MYQQQLNPSFQVRRWRENYPRIDTVANLTVLPTCNVGKLTTLNRGYLENRLATVEGALH